MNKWVQWVLNISVGIFFFFFFLLFFFPFEGVLQNLLHRVEENTKGRYRITVTEIQPSIFFRSVFKNFQLHELDQGKDHVLIDFPEVKMGVSYLPLLAGNFHASFLAKGKKGAIEGRASLSEDAYAFEAEFEKMRLSEIPVLSQKIQFPLDGALNGSLEIDFFPNQWNRNSGNVELDLIDFKIPAGKISPHPAFELDLPDTALSGSKGGKLKLKLGKGKLDIAEFALPGEDLALHFNGFLQLNPRFSLSRVQLSGTFQVSEKLNQALPALIIIEKQKNEQGVYPIELSGRISEPSLKIGAMDIL